MSGTNALAGSLGKFVMGCGGGSSKEVAAAREGAGTSVGAGGRGRIDVGSWSGRVLRGRGRLGAANEVAERGLRVVVEVR